MYFNLTEYLRFSELFCVEKLSSVIVHDYYQHDILFSLCLSKMMHNKSVSRTTNYIKFHMI